MCEPVTAEIGLNACCGHLLTTIGLASLCPERASQTNAMPASGAVPGARLGDGHLDFSVQEHPGIP